MVLKSDEMRLEWEFDNLLNTWHPGNVYMSEYADHVSCEDMAEDEFLYGTHLMD